MALLYSMILKHDNVGLCVLCVLCVLSVLCVLCVLSVLCVLAGRSADKNEERARTCT